ncbi:MAG: TraB/GumN family protein [Sedimenticolaceae bacterium]|nr:TraB/GumN family protein [Sedimenticolaceae bacterium]
MMIKMPGLFRLSVLLLVLLITGCQSATLKTAGRDINANPAMWLAEDDDSKVYLFGSIHVLPEGVRWYTPAIASAFENAEELVIESMAADSMGDNGISDYIDARALLPEGQTLDELLSPGDYARLQELITVLGLDEYQVSRMQPWLLRIVLTSEIFERSGMERTLGVDNLFEQTALRREMKISALETPTEAMMTLAEYPLEVQVKQLSESLNMTAGDAENGDFSGLLVSWAMGDVDRNARLIAASMSPLTYRNVVVERNRKWLPRLEGYLSKPQQTMVVVGNAHLVGKGNLIDMLRHRGHSVSRIQ